MGPGDFKIVERQRLQIVVWRVNIMRTLRMHMPKKISLLILFSIFCKTTCHSII